MAIINPECVLEDDSLVDPGPKWAVAPPRRQKENVLRRVKYYSKYCFLSILKLFHIH